MTTMGRDIPVEIMKRDMDADIMMQRKITVADAVPMKEQRAEKAVDAAGRQLHDIEVLQRQEGGLAALPERLRETAEARLEEPGASIVELGEMLGGSKSGGNHRLRKLHSLAAAAEKAEEKEGDCTI